MSDDRIRKLCDNCLNLLAREGREEGEIPGGLCEPCKAILSAMDAEESEQSYIRGSRAALTGMLAHCLRELGYEDTDATRARWVLEREAAVAALRRVCAEHGDNDWPENLHLADVVDKHLGRHLAALDAARKATP